MIRKELCVTTGDEWRDWLEKNHNVAKEVWLLLYKKHTGKPSIPYENAVEQALCFGWIDSIVRRIDDEKHAQKYTPRRKRSIWSELNKTRANRMMKQGLMTEAGLAKIRQAKENGEWFKNRSAPDLLSIPAACKNGCGKKYQTKQNAYNGLEPVHFISYLPMN